MIKIINPCICDTYCGDARAYAKIEFKNGKLSIYGVIGPKSNGNCTGAAGHCVDEIRSGKPTKDWTNEMLQKFCDIWDRWHLNDINPCCEHQRELGWLDKEKEYAPLYPGDTGAIEKKMLNWLKPEEHPEGLLCRPCPVCGYKYGTSWIREEVPQDVIDWLFSLPESNTKPAWV